MSFGGVIKLQGEKEYKEALKSITQEMKILGSEMKMSEVLFGNNSKSVENLTNKQGILTRRLQEQQKAYDLIKASIKNFQEQQKETIRVHDELITKYEKEKTKLNELKNSNSATTKETKDAEKVVEEYRNKLDKNERSQAKNTETIKKAQAELYKMQTELYKTTKEIENNKRAIEESSTAYGRLTKKISEQERELEDLKKRYVNTVLEQSKGAKGAKELGTKIKNLSKELKGNKDRLKDAESALDKFTEGEKRAGEHATKLGSLIKANVIGGVITSGLKAVGSLLTECGRKVINFSKETEKAGQSFTTRMSEVEALSGATGQDLIDLTNKAQEMGRKTKFTATESAEAFKYMALAGWDTHEMMDGIEGVMNLAAASGENLGRVSDIVTDNITALGLSSKDTKEFVDLLARTVTGTNTTVEDLGQAYKYCATTAGALGFKAKDLNFALGLMADSGLKGSQAGTALRNIMTRLASNTQHAQEVMRNLGVQVINSDGSMRSLKDIITDLRPAFAKLTETQKATGAQIIAGQEGMSGLLAIANATPATFDKVAKAFENTGVTAESMANTMIDNLEGAKTIFSSAVEGFQLSLYKKVEEPLKFVVKEAIESVSRLTAAFNEGGLKGLANQLGKEIASWAAKIEEFLPQLAEYGEKVIDALTEGMESQGDAIVKSISTIITTLLKGAIKLLPQIAKFGVDLIITLCKGIVEALPEIIEQAAEIVRVLLGAIVDHFEDIVYIGEQVIFKIMEGSLRAQGVFLKMVVELCAKIVGKTADYSPLFQKAGLRIIQDILNGMATGNFKFDAIKRIWSELEYQYTRIKPMFEEMGKNLLRGLWTGMRDFANNLMKNNIVKLCGNIVNLFKNCFGIHSPSTVFADEIGKYMAQGIEVGYKKEIQDFGSIIKKSIPTNYEINANTSFEPSNLKVNNEDKDKNPNYILDMFKRALKEMKIELNGDEMGKFIENTVSDSIYAY